MCVHWISLEFFFYVKDLVTKTTILCDTNENGLYKVTGSILEGDSEAGVCHMGAGLSGGLLFLTTSDKSISLYNQWHQKLGHPSFDTTSMILWENGISLIDLSKDLVFCTSCQVSKSHKWLFFAKHYISTIPFALLYLDLCISPKLSYNNDKYFFLSMVGDDNRYICFFSFDN